MSSALWVTLPGGYRVATDEILALMDSVHQVGALVGQSEQNLGALARRSGESAVFSAQSKARDWEEWATWFHAALDRYCETTAQAEIIRATLWDTPRDLLLSAAMKTLVHNAFAKGAESTAHIDDAAAALVGRWPGEHTVQVQLASREQQISQATSLSERIARIPDTGTPVRIERYLLADGTSWVEVFIAGTDSFNPLESGTPFDMRSNVALVAGLSAASVTATSLAMTRAGVKKDDQVLFVGHSQGGAIAHTLAESGKYATAGVITVGAPTGTLPIRGNYPALTIEHSDDLVPGLSGTRVGTNAIVVTTDSGQSVGDLVASHSKESYHHTAKRIERSPADTLSGFTHQFPGGLSGESVTYRVSSH